jgi:hypothetical protein
LLANAVGAVLSLKPFTAKQSYGYERWPGGEEKATFVRALLHCAGVPGQLGKNGTLCRSQGQTGSCGCHTQQRNLGRGGMRSFSTLSLLVLWQ